MFMKLPIKFLDEDSKEYANYKKMSDLLGKDEDPPLTDGFIHVNFQAITAFFEGKDGNLVLMLNSGARYDVYIKYKQFLADFINLQEELDGEGNSTSNGPKEG